MLFLNVEKQTNMRNITSNCSKQQVKSISEQTKDRLATCARLFSHHFTFPNYNLTCISQLYIGINKIIKQINC